MKISEKRKVGEKLGREGLAQAIMALALQIASGTYKDAVAGAGKMSVLAEACTYEEYWEEKMLSGKYSQESCFERILLGS